MINKFKKIVIKIGSSSIIDEKTRKIKIKWLNSICKDIEVLNNENRKIGIGVIAYDSYDAKKIIRKNSKDIKRILGYEGRDELIHKDDLVKINT